MTQKEFFTRRLPHWHPNNATFFVTFGLEGSLPAAVVAQIQAEHETLRQQLQTEKDPARRSDLYHLSKQLFKRYDNYLDQGQGERWLANPDVARVICEQIRALHPKHYYLYACCVMPTHIHLLVDTKDIPPPPPTKDGKQHTSLSQALFLLKGRSARLSNQILNRKGTFWRHESYDHVVRDEKELERILGYILNNPVKAGMVNHWQEYPFLYLDETLIVPPSVQPPSGGLAR
jgi:REP element-mobilizing transposase RayT